MVACIFEGFHAEFTDHCHLSIEWHGYYPCSSMRYGYPAPDCPHGFLDVAIRDRSQGHHHAYTDP